MTFEEIEKMVSERLPEPEHTTLEESFCFDMLDLLLQRYRQGTISRDAASLRKAKIKVLFGTSKHYHDTYREIMREYQDNIKRADTLRSDIIKGVRNGVDISVVLIMAVKCIGLMTGDKTFERIVKNETDKMCNLQKVV